MAEITGKEKREEGAGAEINGTVHFQKGSVEDVEVDLLAGFTPEEAARLLGVKEKVARGLYTDLTVEHKKLLFTKWLIEHKRLEK